MAFNLLVPLSYDGNLVLTGAQMRVACFDVTSKSWRSRGWWIFKIEARGFEGELLESNFAMRVILNIMHINLRYKIGLRTSQIALACDQTFLCPNCCDSHRQSLKLTLRSEIEEGPLAKPCTTDSGR